MIQPLTCYIFPQSADTLSERQVKIGSCATAIPLLGYSAYHCMASSFRKGLPWLAAGVISLLVGAVWNFLHRITTIKQLKQSAVIQIPIKKFVRNNDLYDLLAFKIDIENEVKQFLVLRLSLQKNQISIGDIDIIETWTKNFIQNIKTNLEEPITIKVSMIKIEGEKEFLDCYISSSKGLGSFFENSGYYRSFFAKPTPTIFFS